MIHLYKRSIKKNGKIIKVWYYWFYDESGKQVRRSCGQNGKPCLTKRDAEAFIENLNLDKEKKDITLSDFCTGMYDEGSAYLRNRAAKGQSYYVTTLEQRRFILSVILQKFGNKKVSELSVSEIDGWLCDLPKSTSWKNIAILIFNEIYKELYKAKKIDYIPLIEKFKESQKEKGSFSVEEIKKMFPKSYDEIIKIWRWKSSRDVPDWKVFEFATLIYVALTTGMRSGEVRALKYSQFISRNAVLINSMLSYKNVEVDHLKKGSDTNKKWRIAILPDRAVDMIEHLKKMSPSNDDSAYIFTTNSGKLYYSATVNKILKEVLNNLGIDTKEKNISMHSTRYTYNTMMRRSIDDSDLRLMMGHTNEKMTDYYDKSTIFDRLPELMKDKSVIDSIWN